jgi:lipoate-protein ligase A
MALPSFGDIVRYEAPLADGITQEGAWLARAAESGRAAAHLWQATPMLVVPRSYARLPGWARACADAAGAGWPVQVRGSGGGLVPLGPGLLNLSLVWRAAPVATIDPHAIYRAFCGLLSGALARLSVEASAQAVVGSFCDGRFNLAAGGRKIAGTAQAWRRIDGRQAVLAHAVVIVSAEPDALTEVANRFEAAAASRQRYRAEALTSVARVWSDAHAAAAPADLDRQLATAIVAELAAHERPAAVTSRRARAFGTRPIA